MPASFDGWTLSDIGHSNGPSGSDPCCPDGKMDIPFGPATTGDGWTSHLSERSNVPYEVNFNSHADVNHAWGRVDVPDPISGDLGCPAPFHGGKGQTLDLNTVGDRAADNDHGAGAPDGSPASTGNSFLPGPILD